VTSPSEDDFAESLRGFGPLGILSVLAVFLTGNVVIGSILSIPVGAILVLMWARRSRTPWREIGFSRPRSWIGVVAAGLALGVGFKLLMKSVVMPLLGAGPINQAYHFLAGNRAMLPAAAWTLLAAGFSEETMFRGFAFERLRKLLGAGRLVMPAIVLLTSLPFGLVHYGIQGLAGVQQATIVGLVFGSIYALTGRIWMPMIAHTAFDLTALGIIYWDLESAVAGCFFDPR